MSLPPARCVLGDSTVTAETDIQHPFEKKISHFYSFIEDNCFWGSIPGSGRSLGAGNGTQLQYFCLESSMGRGAWWAASPWGCREPETAEHTHTHDCLPVVCAFLLHKAVNQLHVYRLALPLGLPSHTHPTLQVTAEPQAELPALNGGFPLSQLFHGRQCMCQPSCPSSSHPPLSPLCPHHLFSASASLFLPCRQAPLYNFSRFHIYAL